MISKKLTTTAGIIIFLLTIITIEGRAQRDYQPNILAPIVTNMRVNSFTGNLYHQRLDLFIPSIGIDLDFTFYYNSSLRDEDWGYGYGWTHTFNKNYVSDDDGNIIILQEDGRRDTFFLSAETYIPPVGVYQILEEYENNKFRVTMPGGTMYYFENPNHQRLTKIEDRYGNTVNMEYENGKPILITDASGRSISLNWENSRLKEIIDELEEPTRKWIYSYTTEGNLEEVTDPLNGKVTYGYNNEHGLINMTDKNENDTSIRYNNTGGVVKLTTCLLKQVFTYLPSQNKTILEEFISTGKQSTIYKFDEEGRNISKTGSCCGYKKEFVYDSLNNIIMVIDANGNDEQFIYGPSGKATQTIDQDGCVSDYSYDNPFGKTTSYTDKKGTTITYDYDEKGNLTQINLPMNLTEKFEYNDLGLRTSSTNRNGYVTNYTYNENGYLIAKQYPISSIVDSFTYDQRGNLESFTDANGNTTEYKYDLLNRLIQITNALGYQTNYAYDAAGNRISFTDALGNETEYDYNGHNYIVEIRFPLETTYKMKYDGRGNLLRRTLPNGGEFSFTYNDQNIVETETDPLGNITFFSYDANGNRTTVTDPNGISNVYDYDELNRLKSFTNGLGFKTFFYFDCNNNLDSIVASNGSSISYEYDVLDRGITATDELGSNTHYEYDKNNNLKKITDAKGNATNYEFDEMNRLIVEEFADGTSKLYTFDGANNITSRVDNNGDTTRYSYNVLNLLTFRNYPDSNDDHFEYDSLGRISRALNHNAEVLFEIDELGRITKETLNGIVTKFAYNSSLGKKTIIYPSGRIIEEFLNKNNQLKSIKENGSLLASFEYDAGRRLINKSLSNGTSCTYAYDANNQIIEMEYYPESFVHFKYGYDNVGNKIYEEKLHHPSNSEQYEYDIKGQLTAFKVGSLINSEIQNPISQSQYTYNSLGNRIQAVIDGIQFIYDSNNMNEYTSIEENQSIIPNYDDNGNLISFDDMAFNYNFENRLENISNGEFNTIYKYDALGRRVSKEELSTTTFFFFDGNKKIEESNTNSVNSSFVYGSFIDEIIKMNTDFEESFSHINGLFSTVALSNENGDVFQRFEYSDFGDPIIMDQNFNIDQSNSSNFPNLFTGREFEKETNTYYYRNRYLFPQIGHFLSRDPLEYIDGMNLFTYVLNNPLKYTDPFGLQTANCENEYLYCRHNVNFQYQIREELVSDIVGEINETFIESPCRKIASWDKPDPTGEYIICDAIAKVSKTIIKVPTTIVGTIANISAAQVQNELCEMQQILCVADNLKNGDCDE